MRIRLRTGLLAGAAIFLRGGARAATVPPENAERLSRTIQTACAQAWMHGGRINGYAATVWHVPAESLTIAVAANRDGADGDAIAAALIDASRDAR